MIVTLTPLFMALVINIINGRGPTNEMCPKLKPKNTYVGKALSAITTAAKDV